MYPGHFMEESLPIGDGTKRANVVQARYEPGEASHLFLISLGDLTINHVIKSGLAEDTTTDWVESILHSTTFNSIHSLRFSSIRRCRYRT